MSPLYPRGPGHEIEELRERHRLACEANDRMGAMRDEARAEVERLREALIPFAFIGRSSVEPMGLADEYDHARKLLGL